MIVAKLIFFESAAEAVLMTAEWLLMAIFSELKLAKLPEELLEIEFEFVVT